MTKYHLRLLAVALAACATIAQAQPFSLSYSGRLTEASGKPVTGPVDLSIQFHSHPTNTAPLGVPVSDHADVALLNGTFQVTLTLTDAEYHIAFDTPNDVWVEVRDVTHDKTYPRQRFSAVPYALKVPVDDATISYDSTGKLTIKVDNLPAVNKVLKVGAGGDLTWSDDLTGGVGSVGNGDLQNDAVDSAKIQDLTIAAVDIANGAITDDKLAAITTAGKVADTALSATVTKLGNSIDLTSEVGGIAPVANLPVGTTAAHVAAGNHGHSNATTVAAGFMSAADKTAIDAQVANSLVDGDFGANGFMLRTGPGAYNTTATISGNDVDGGVITNFASTGIDDNANANAMTIDASENITIVGALTSTNNAATSRLGGVNFFNGGLWGQSGSMVVGANSSKVEISPANINAAAGVETAVTMASTFNPTSGTSQFNFTEVRPVINQTGGANGLTRGIWLNPTLTSAPNFRALDISNASGMGVYQSGAGAENFFAGNVGVGTANPDAKLEVYDGDLRIKNTAGGYVDFKTAAGAGTATYTFPTSGQTGGYVLKTDGSGVLSWGADSTGGSPSFNTIATGINTTAAMTVGTGGSILTTGSGAVESTVFKGSGTTTNAVDLATAEVSGILPIANGGIGTPTGGGPNRVLATPNGMPGNAAFRALVADDIVAAETDPKMQTLTSAEVDQLETIGASVISAAQWSYLGAMSAQPLQAETDPKMQTLSSTQVDQLENLGATTVSSAQWGYLGAMSAQPLQTESDPKMQTLTTAEVDQLETIGTSVISATQWGYLGAMSAQPLQTESDPKMQTLTTAEVDQLETIGTSVISATQWGYLGAMSAQPLQTESDPKMQTLSSTQVDQLENLGATTVSSAQWGYLGALSAAPALSGVNTNITSLTGISNGGTVGVAGAEWLFDDTNNDISTAGNVGLGYSAPTSQLDIRQTNAATTGTLKQLNTELTLTNAGVSSAWPTGASFHVGVNHTAVISNNVTAVNARVQTETTGSTANVAGLIAVDGSAANHRPSTVSSLYGGKFESHSNGTGNVSTMYGVTGTSTLNLSTTGTAYGGKFNVHTGTGTIGTAYGIHTNISRTSGPINNGYGLFIDTIDATTKYGVYQTDATAQNYFAGHTGIGNNNPLNMLTVGLPDTTQAGKTVLFTGQGSGTAEGGELMLQFAADHDGTTEGFTLDAYEDDFRIFNGALVRMQIRGDNGYVGIGGVLAPSYMLHVVGDAGKTSGGTTWIAISDARLKDVSGDFTAGLDEVSQLRPVRFRYKQNNELGLSPERENIGFVAQEVQQLIPDAVRTREDGYLELNVDPIMWATVNAVRELKEENAELRAKNAMILALVCADHPDAEVCRE